MKQLNYFFSLNFLKANFFLLLIILFFLFTRFYKIAEIPPSVYWDEASIGYNAYSVSIDGKDEWGDFLPLHFRAFGEFKLPVYIYSTALTVKIFGLNELSIRIPSVVFSLGILILTYLIAFRIMNNKLVGLFSAFFITISQWFFIFSRTGYEASAGLMFFLLGIYLTVFWNRIWVFLIGVLSLILSIYSYNSFRIIIPLLIPFLLYLNWYLKGKDLLDKKKIFIVVSALLIFIISFIPIFKVNIYDTASIRNSTISIFNKSEDKLKIFLLFLKNYASHFQPKFLLFSGDSNTRSHLPGFGQLNIIEFILILLSLVGTIMIRRLRRNIFIWFVYFSIFVSFIPASITTESPHALRSVAVVPFISIITALGVYILIFKSKEILPTVFFVLTLSLMLFGLFFYNFINSYPINTSKDWQYANRELVYEYKDTFKNFDKVYISDIYGQPYIFNLFYLKHAPKVFRSDVKRSLIGDWGFSSVDSFGNFEFKDIKKIPEVKDEIKRLESVLLFNSEKVEIEGLKEIDVIKFKNGEDAYFVYKKELEND